MASDLEFVTYVAAQMEGAGPITYRKMFGEYAVYCRGKVVALVCDNQVFVKPTEKGRLFIGTPIEAPAYPGAKNSFLIEDRLDDRAWLGELIRLTERELAPAKVQHGKRAARSHGASERSASAKKATVTKTATATSKAGAAKKTSRAKKVKAASGGAGQRARKKSPS